MMGDPFGNLKEWGRVIETLEQMKEKGELDDAQPGLIRLICYPDNWRIREQALIAARQVAQPNSALLGEIATVLMDSNTYADVRILAARALGDLAGRDPQTGSPDGFGPDEILVILKGQLATPEAPVFHHVVKEVIRKIEQAVKEPAV
jgi:hypothetical protein